MVNTISSDYRSIDYKNFSREINQSQNFYVQTKHWLSLLKKIWSKTDPMTKTWITVSTIWSLFCLGGLSHLTQNFLETFQQTHQHHFSTLDVHRVIFVLYTSVPLFMWLFLSLKKLDLKNE